MSAPRFDATTFGPVVAAAIWIIGATVIRHRWIHTHRRTA